ncbi:uncharacterized protein MELLADRAFT_109728 [Melampsora larici-populina 98AG31]|uniref:Uncharacterized protein n=1 Tax=Melampsora larici-populina (strain 98AG31 / pathotype 3-4-7) TaxID=747676 RepID=F4RXF2_MELLP|nr:uncharacterized protein MELLADRAFT_109728 [Melampsora larici-populina 98AG31]EGG02997.1 hypothetical protein MELLADRAFT_109728 [Melampsora larici-populina 98AG31]
MPEPQLIFDLADLHLNSPFGFVSGPASAMGYAYHARPNPNHDGYHGTESTCQLIRLQDLRTAGLEPTLDIEGFTYVSGRHIPENLSKDGYQELVEADSVALVKNLTGATSAIVFDTTFRGNFDSESRKIVPIIHSGMSPEGAKILKEHFQDQWLNLGDTEMIQFGKYLEKNKDCAIVNVWRPIQTVENNPLGLCKWNSLAEEDVLDFGVKPQSASTTVQPWEYKAHQEWFYLSEQKPDEAYVFMQHDSRAKDGHGINVPHASFRMKDDNPESHTRQKTHKGNKDIQNILNSSKQAA